MPLTDAQKRAKLNWISKNKEHHNSLQNIYAKNYYENNKELCRVKALQRYYLKKQLKENEPTSEV